MKNSITDEQIERAFENTNFGDADRRELLRESLLKVACGYVTGHTIEEIGIELGLRRARPRGGLTKKGQLYLYEAYEGKTPFFSTDRVNRK